MDKLGNRSSVTYVARQSTAKTCRDGVILCCGCEQTTAKHTKVETCCLYLYLYNKL